MITKSSVKIDDVNPNFVQIKHAERLWQTSVKHAKTNMIVNLISVIRILVNKDAAVTVIVIKIHNIASHQKIIVTLITLADVNQKKRMELAALKVDNVHLEIVEVQTIDTKHVGLLRWNLVVRVATILTVFLITVDRIMSVNKDAIPLVRLGNALRTTITVNMECPTIANQKKSLRHIVGVMILVSRIDVRALNVSTQMLQ